MQEPGQLRESQQPQLASMLPIGYVISQEAKAPRRVQVRLPQYHTGIPDEDLPYYLVLHPADAMGHNGRTKRWVTLAPGTQVQVCVYDARGYSGIVMGCIPNTSNGYEGDSLYGYVDDFGNSFSVAADGTMMMSDSAGATVTMGAGKVVINATEFDVNAKTIKLNGETITQTANGWSVTASGPSIVDNGGGVSGPTLTAPTLPQAPDVSNKTDI